MEKHPIAVIDLGSNTFHILIAYIRDGAIEEIDRKRVFVGLGDGGIEFLKQSSIDMSNTLPCLNSQDLACIGQHYIHYWTGEL